MDIRKETCIIIRREGYYLQGRKWLSSELLWTVNAYDAWRTRRKEHAELVAGAVGGEMVLFNPIVNQKKVIESWQEAGR